MTAEQSNNENNDDTKQKAKSAWRRARDFMLAEVLPAVIIIAVIVAIVYGLTSGPPDMAEDPWQYRNFHAVIVSMGEDAATTPDKFHTPTSVIAVTFAIVSDSVYSHPLTCYDYGFVLRKYTMPGQAIRADEFANEVLSDEWYANHRVGDIVYFNYIASGRVFNLDRCR